MNGPSAGSQPFSLTTPAPAPFGPSLAKNLEPVTRFLVEKAGQPLNEFEAAGIVDYIQKNVQGTPGACCGDMYLCSCCRVNVRS